MNSRHIGPSLESLFDELGEREEFEALTMKKIIADRVRFAMQKQRHNNTTLAEAMRTKRPQVQRLLDPSNTSLTIATLAKAAVALKMSFFDLGPRPAPKFFVGKPKPRPLFAAKAARKAVATHRKGAVKRHRAGLAKHAK